MNNQVYIEEIRQEILTNIFNKSYENIPKLVDLYINKSGLQRYREFLINRINLRTRNNYEEMREIFYQIESGEFQPNIPLYVNGFIEVLANNNFYVAGLYFDVLVSIHRLGYKIVLLSSFREMLNKDKKDSQKQATDAYLQRMGINFANGKYQSLVRRWIDIDKVFEYLNSTSVDIDSACHLLGLNTDEANIVKLICAREYYGAKQEKRAKQILTMVEQSKEKSLLVTYLVNQVRQNAKFYQYRLQDKQKTLVLRPTLISINDGK